MEGPRLSYLESSLAFSEMTCSPGPLSPQVGLSQSEDKAPGKQLWLPVTPFTQIQLRSGQQSGSGDSRFQDPFWYRDILVKGTALFPGLAGQWQEESNREDWDPLWAQSRWRGPGVQQGAWELLGLKKAGEAHDRPSGGTQSQQAVCSESVQAGVDPDETACSEKRKIDKSVAPRVGTQACLGLAHGTVGGFSSPTLGTW